MRCYHRLQGKPDAHPIGAPRIDEILVKRDSYHAPSARLNELAKTIAGKKRIETDCTDRKPAGSASVKGREK